MHKPICLSDIESSPTSSLYTTLVTTLKPWLVFAHAGYKLEWKVLSCYHAILKAWHMTAVTPMRYNGVTAVLH